MLKALGKDIAIYGAGEFVFKFIAFAVFPIYAHMLSVADFGVLALLQVTALLVGNFANVGVSQAMQRFYFETSNEAGREARVVSTGLAHLILSSVLLSGCAILVTAMYQTTFASHYGISLPVAIIAFACVVPDQILQYCLDVLRIHFTPLKFMALSFAKNVIGTVVALYLLLVHHAGLEGIFLGLLIGSSSAVPFGLWLIRRDLRWHYSAAIGRSLIAFGAPLVFTSVAHWIYTSLDRWMLAGMATPEEIGLYSVAVKFSTILTFVISAFAQAWIPFAIKMSRDNANHLEFFGRILSLWSFALAFGALGLALFAREGLMLLTPAIYWPAAPIVPVLAAGVAVFGTTLVTALGITLSNRTILSTAGTWLAAVVNFALNLALIPRFGAIGTATATLIAYFSLTAFYLFSTQRLHPIPVEPRKLLYSGALTLSAAAISMVDFGDLGFADIFLKVGILLLAFVGAFAVRIIDRSMLNVVRWKGKAWQGS